MANTATKTVTRLCSRLLGSFERPVIESIIKLRENAYCAKITAHLSIELERKVSLGQVARCLDTLKSLGVVESKRVQPHPPQKNQRSRIVFSVTQKGKLLLAKTRQFEQWDSELDTTQVFNETGSASNLSA